MAAGGSIDDVRNRRALGLVVLSVLVPGSAQYLAGSRLVGRWAMRVWAGGLALLLLTLLGLWLLRGPTLALLLHPVVAPTLRAAAWLWCAAWILLLLDAWRLARPLGLDRRARLTLTISCLVLALLAGAGTAVASGGLAAVSNVAGVFAGGGDPHARAGRYNVLLLGVDAADGREGLRPDSISVASIDAATGRTVLFGLPRNLQRAPFPADSPLHALYPDGFVCDDGACMLNGVWTLADDHADLFDVAEPGLATTRDVVGEILGLDINYYALVDMAGFKDLIDAMGGIRLDIAKPIPMGGVSTKIHGYIGPGEGVLLDGYHALWFARSRAESSDYERMIRQKCVMAAMAKQLDPATVATRFVQLSEAGGNLLRTDVGAGDLARLAELALAGRRLDVATVNFAPPLVTPADPDFDLIRRLVADELAASQALDAAAGRPAAEPAGATRAPAEPVPASGPAADPAGPGDSPSPASEGDVEPVCRVS